jgi:NRPS condensation-like uncharacterized protein
MVRTRAKRTNDKDHGRSDDIVVNNLETAVIARLKARAKIHGHSLNDEVLEIIRCTVDRRRTSRKERQGRIRT